MNRYIGRIKEQHRHVVSRPPGNVIRQIATYDEQKRDGWNIDGEDSSVVADDLVDTAPVLQNQTDHYKRKEPIHDDHTVAQGVKTVHADTGQGQDNNPYHRG